MASLAQGAARHAQRPAWRALRPRPAQRGYSRRFYAGQALLVACWWRAGGVLVVMVDLTMLQPVLDAADSGRDGFVTLFLADGWLLATTPRNEALFERH